MAGGDARAGRAQSANGARAASDTISLVGMPGSGKSSVGRLLARRLQLRFIDADAVFESRQGCSIKVFFAQHGEAEFRLHEAALIAELVAQSGVLLSTGGGAVLSAANRLMLRSHSLVIYLRAPPAELYRRLQRDQIRPLLQVADPLAKLRLLYEARDALYRAAAHRVIETGHPSVFQVVNHIAMQVEMDRQREV